ncbi:MAG: IS1595 family transposase [Gammaproteobacteria bacterium]|nr:IS1595 family transposase [Gammaproteobacteria bacterium]
MTNKTTMGELEFLNWVGTTEDEAVKFFEARRWPFGRFCPACGSVNTYEHTSRKHYYHCKDCRKQFSCKIGTVMEGTRLPVKEWLWVMYKISVSRKGVSSVQLAKELNRPQKTTWFMLQRMKEACGNKTALLSGVVEADEKYVGGRETNKHESKKLKLGRGPSGKQPVFGIRERDGEVIAVPVDTTDSATLQSKIHEHVKHGSEVYTDEHKSYNGLDGLFYSHDTVKHSAKEYVRGSVHTNGIESVWAILERTITGVHHHISVKHLKRYLNEVCYRLNEGNVKVHVKDRVSALCLMCAGVTLPWKRLVRNHQRSF